MKRIKHAEVTRLLWRRAALGLVTVVLLAPAAGCPPIVINTGNLEIREDGNIEFATGVVTQEVTFDSAQLQAAPQASFRTHDVEVDYSDDFQLTTIDSQRALLVMARDPDEEESALEAIGPIDPKTCGEDVTRWLNETAAPHEFPDQYRTVGGVSLPDSLDLAFPTDANRVPLTTSVNASEFAGDFTTPLVLGAAGDSIKGLYVLQHGACSTEVSIQSSILFPILEQLPGAVIQGINDGNPSGLAQGSPQIRELGMASFVTRNGATPASGGFVQYLAIHEPFQFPPLVNDAVVTRNYSYFFTLNNGILATTAQHNTQADCDTGFFSGTMANGLDGSVPSQVSNGIYLAALAQQTRPIPRLTGNPDCSNPDLSQKPSSCFAACVNIDPDPTKWPKPLDPSNTDDSSWYSTSFCQDAADTVDLGVGQGALNAASNELNPTIQSELMQTSTQEAVASTLTGIVNGDTPRFKSVRCNFYPTYVAPDPMEFGGKPTPVCEFVIRAKRLNVFPDTLELVWFDAPATNNVLQSTLNEAGYAVFLLSNGANCTRRPQIFATGLDRPFAHVSFY